jgi:hypothetical protein
LAPSWHNCAAGGSTGPGVATTLKLDLPKGVKTAVEWSYPDPTVGPDRQMIYEGSLALRRQLRIGSDAPAGPMSLTCELGYQACDPVSCRPPTKLQLVARDEVVMSGSESEQNRVSTHWYYLTRRRDAR